ncbi:MAG: glycoside hydrolase family 11 protein [Spirochaetales bacterium]|nr:glycoside hydrolase family 11 protein [Spirochaetales bacterium]
MGKLFFNKRKIILVLVIVVYFTGVFTITAQTICTNSVGTRDGYTYEFWKDNGGTACMTLGTGAGFSVEWSNVNELLVRIGKRPGSEGINIYYRAEYQPDGNFYSGVYGKTRNPDIEYYIIDNWGPWRPPGEGLKGTFDSDGATYDIYEPTPLNTPGMTGPVQYWSVRQSKRASGAVTIANHFNAWKTFGMNMGVLYEVSFCVKGIQSSGTADVYELAFGSQDETPAPTPDSESGDVNGDGNIDILDALLTAQYYVGLPVSSPFIEANADVDKDGVISIMDALEIAQYSVGLIDEF